MANIDKSLLSVKAVSQSSTMHSSLFPNRLHLKQVKRPCLPGRLSDAWLAGKPATPGIVFYGEAGAHARSAVGRAALPNGACIEIEMIMEVED